MSAQSIGASHRLMAENANVLAVNNRVNYLMDNVLHNKLDENNSIKCKNIIINNINNNIVVNESNAMNTSSSKNGNHCGLNMFSMPFNNVSSLYLFNSEAHHPNRGNAGQSSGTTAAITTHNPSTNSTLKSISTNNINNNNNSLREGTTPSPLSLSSISNNDSTGNSFPISKPSRTSDGLISGLNFNHSDVLREGGFMSYGSSPAENAASTPNSFTTCSLDGYLNAGQGGPSSNHSFDLLDSDSFSEMPNTLSPSCQTTNTYDDNSGHTYAEHKQKGQSTTAMDRNCGDGGVNLPTRKKRKNGPTVRPACSDCGKEFSNQSALSKHKLTHSDERKFVCSQCSKAFKRQDHLNGHLLTHRSKKPYECDVEGCEKTYCDARSLRRHKENHHPVAGVTGSTNGQTQSIQTLAFIPGIALNFSTANLGVGPNQSMNRIQYAPPPQTTQESSQVSTTALAPAVKVSAVEQSAATHLQRLALHKQDDNIQHNTRNDDKWVGPPSREGPSTQKWNQISELNKNSFIDNNISNEIAKQSIKSELYNKLQSISGGPMSSSNSGLLNDSSQENALLHQLLTQEHFKEKQNVYQQHQSEEQSQHHDHHQQQQQQQQHPTTTQPQHSLPLPRESQQQQQQQQQHKNQTPQQSLQQSIQQSLPQMESHSESITSDNWPYTMFAQNNNKSEPQNVQCSLCQRKFKNIPALNGHMRLHGGYLKNQTQNNLNNSSLVNSKKDNGVHKAHSTQVNANVKAILDVIKDKISRKQLANNMATNMATNLGQPHQQPVPPPRPPPPPAHHQQQQQNPPPSHHMSHIVVGAQMMNSPMAPILSPVTPVTPKTGDHNRIESTFNYDFHQTSATNGMHYTREDHDLYYENEIHLLKEQLQQSVPQQFRMPCQPSNIISNRSQAAQEQRQQQARRHSDSSDMSGNCLENNVCKQQQQTGFESTNDCYSSQHLNDLLRRRTQRTSSDPGDQPLMTINTNYQSPGHSLYGHQYYNQSHSVPTTPTMCQNSSSSVANNFQPHSLPSTPTLATAPVTFVPSPHSHMGSVPNTPTDANQQFNFMAVPSPVAQGSVHSQHSQYSASPASVAQYSPNTPYSPSHASVTQFTYSVGQSQAPSHPLPPPSPAPQHENSQNVYEESQMYDAIHNYTNAGSVGVTTADDHSMSENFNFDPNLAQSQTYFESPNDMMSDTGAHHMQAVISGQSIAEHMSIQSSIPQTSSKEQQFFSSFHESTPNTSQEYNHSNHSHPMGTTSIHYVQSSANYWPQSSLANSVQSNGCDMKAQPVLSAPQVLPKSTTIMSANSSNHMFGMFSSPSGPSIPDHSLGESSSANRLSNRHNIEYMSSVNLMPESLNISRSCVNSSSNGSSRRRSTSSPPHLVVNLEKIDECNEEMTDDVFLSPVGVAPSPKRTSPSLPSVNSTNSSKRLKHRPEPLYIPPHVNTCGYQSRLRSPRLWDPSAVIDTKNLSPPPYTPPPMLSPVRSGPGLFWHIISGSMTPKSGTIAPKFVYSRKSSIELKEKEEPLNSSYQSTVAQTPTTAYEPYDCEIPETDIQPHVNIGPTFQARIPTFNKNKDEAKLRKEKADLIWDPTIADSLNDEDIESFLELSCSACVPGSGRNKEYAMHLLSMAEGDIHRAIAKLLEPHPNIAEGHPLADYHYPENDIWVPSEIESYQNALNKCDKDFFGIAKEVGTKSVKQCIQFYYMWKKVCPEEYRRLRIIRRKRENETYFYNLRSKECEENNNNIKLDFETLDNNNEMNGGLTNSGQSSDMDDHLSSLMDSTNPSPATSVGSHVTVVNSVPESSYPCKLCGKVFQKVKSRSAHMKIHGSSGSAKY